MLCSIHQPNYLPYLGMFEKIARSDVFVFYDITQYTKNDYRNRNTIKWPNGPILLTLPTFASLSQMIKDTKFDNRILAKHRKTIQSAYQKAPYFEQYKSIFEEIYAYQWDNISDFDIMITKKLCEILWIQTKIVVLSDLVDHLQSKSTDALIEVCKLVGADEYLSGKDGKNYVEMEKFDEAWIKVYFQDYQHPTYSQLWGDFIPYMSVIDLIFNEWPHSLKIIMG